jgi:two-component system nitrate/nitrite response regulator NarL
MGRDQVAGPVTVAIIEDHPVVIEGIRSWIAREKEPAVLVVATGDSIEAVLDGPGGTADVLVLDLNLNGRLVVDRVGELCAVGHRVVVFSQHAEPEIVLAVLEAGASDFVAKDEGPDHCVAAIVSAATNLPYVTPSVAGAMTVDTDPNRPKLSEKERLALLWWFQGMSKASVAQRMGIAESTVRQYIGRARAKYAMVGREAVTKTALLARAIEDGLIRPDEVSGYRSFGFDPRARSNE